MNPGASAICWAACLALVACGHSGETLHARPNVLLLVIDALRADALGVNGYHLPTSPALDKLAADGVSFTAAFAPATWTRPSMATLMTSLYPPEHGLQANLEQREGRFLTPVLEERFVTLAEAMQAGGYRTAAVVNQVHLQARFGFAQGFAAYKETRGLAAPGLRRELLARLGGPSDRPFFAYVHFLDVHWPYCSRLAPPEIERFGGRMTAEERGGKCDRERAAPANEQRPRYDAEVAFADDTIGRLMADLRQRGLYENTIVVVTADHGEAFGERGTFGHAGPPHLEQTRVPLLFRLPGGKPRPPRLLDVVVGLVDVAPTLLELVGLPALLQAQGRSLAPLLRGERLAERFVYSQGAGGLAVRGHRWAWLKLADGTLEVYDRQRDPAERAPIQWACAGDCARLQPAAERYLRLARRVRPSGRVTAPLSAEDLEELRSLGYL